MPLINSAQERQELMERLYGIQQVIIAPFDREMMTMPWQDFITELLVKRYGAVHLVAGHDYHFGHKNAGDPVLLQQKCRELGLGCDIIPKVELPTSASWWRADRWSGPPNFWATATVSARR